MAVWLDDLFPDHPKVVAVGGDAAWLYVCGLCYCRRHLTDGRIPMAAVPRLTDCKSPMKLAARLVAVGLWHEDGDGWRVHDWDKHNDSAETIRAQRSTVSTVRSEAGRKGAHARWHASGWHGKTDGKPDSKPMAEPSDPDSKSDGKTMRSQCDPDGKTIASRWQTDGPSPKPSIKLFSSSNTGVGAPGCEEEENSQIQTTARLVAERRLARRRGEAVVDRLAWLGEAQRRVETEAGELIRAMLADGLTPQAAADAIDRTGGWSRRHSSDEVGPCPGCGAPPGSPCGSGCMRRVEWEIDEATGLAVRR